MRGPKCVGGQSICCSFPFSLCVCCVALPFSSSVVSASEVTGPVGPMVGYQAGQKIVDFLRKSGAHKELIDRVFPTVNGIQFTTDELGKPHLAELGFIFSKI